METMMIGEAIRQLRLARNMTQQELMDRAFLTRSQIHYIEKNKRTPRKQTLENISAALGISLFELLAYVFQ
ncbi:MAG TPA: helix-turn-helix transcriptional regulator [Sphaerochaeta sp.]|nr:helix-turn-helix transcriptional regulator [Sphaerochaeta sp.]